MSTSWYLLLLKCITRAFRLIAVGRLSKKEEREKGLREMSRPTASPAWKLLYKAELHLPLCYRLSAAVDHFSLPLPHNHCASYDLDWQPHTCRL
ncbi:MAG: hypothetical protein ACPLRM_00290 [Anaerolineae bacterium]